MMKIISAVIRFVLFFITVFPLLFIVGFVVYLFPQSIPIFSNQGLNFLLGTMWNPVRRTYGIFPMLIGSIIITLTALVISLPCSLSLGVFLTEYLRGWQKDAIRYLLFTFSGIPPIIYGFFGLVVVVPFVRIHFGGPGYSIIAASIILAIMVLPTLSISIETALINVPIEYKETALASSGANRIEAIYYIVLPIAKPGILAGIFLGLARVLGETSAILLITGNVAVLPKSITSPIRTLTANIALELGEATGEHRQAVLASAFVLMFFIGMVNWAIQVLLKTKH